MLDKLYRIGFLEYDPLDEKLNQFRSLGIKIIKDNDKCYVSLNAISDYLISTLNDVTNESNDAINKIREEYQENKEWLDRNQSKIKEQDNLIIETDNQIKNKLNIFLDYIKKKEEKINDSIQELDNLKDKLNKKIEDINSEDYNEKISVAYNEAFMKAIRPLIKKYNDILNENIKKLDEKINAKEIIEKPVEKKEVVENKDEIKESNQEREKKELEYKRLQDNIMEF